MNNTIYATALAIDPTDPTILYAGTSDMGVYKSTNGGGSWSWFNNGLTTYLTPGDYTLAIDPSNSSTLYAGFDSITGGGNRFGGVDKSTNRGVSWSDASNGLPYKGIKSLVIDPSNTATLYAGTYANGVYKSTNGGGSWSEVNNGLIDKDAWALTLDPVNPATLYAGTWGGGVFKSTNGGQSWSAFSGGLTSMYVYTLTIDPSNPATLYAGTQSGVFTFTRVSNAPGVTTGSAIAITPTSATLNGTVNPKGFVTTAQLEFGLTTAYGSTANVTLSPNDGSSTQGVSAAISGLQSGMTYHYRITATNSQGSGVGSDSTFTLAQTGEWYSVGPYGGNISALVVDPFNPTTLFAGTDSGVFKSQP